jgi:hypothetical protein
LSFGISRLAATQAIRLAVVSLYLTATHAYGVEIGSGLEAIEDGDDRLRPAALVHIATDKGFITRGYVYGRDYGPVSERNYLLAIGKRFDFSSKTWQGIIGLAVLADTTEIIYKDYPQDNSSYTSTNVGMAFGVHWNIFDAKAFRLKATWDSHVFPAGTGFLFLANARKSGLGLTAATVF